MAAQSNFGGLLKLALIGGGAYLLFKNTTLPAGSIFGGSPATPNGAPAPAAPVVTNPAPQTVPPSVQPGPAEAPAPSNDRDALARLAATGNAAAVVQSDAWGIRYNSDQWNWLRAAGGGGTTTTDLFPPGDRGYLMLVSEYLSRRQAAGLSGLRGGWRQS